MENQPLFSFFTLPLAIWWISQCALFISWVYLAAVVKVVKFLSEVVEDFRMARHVRCKDKDYHVPSHLFLTVIAEKIYPHLLELLSAEVGEDVALGGGEDLEGDGTVMVLEGGHVIVPGEMLICTNHLGPDPNKMNDSKRAPPSQIFKTLRQRQQMKEKSM